MKTEHKIIAAILIGSFSIVGNTVWKESENAKTTEALKAVKSGTVDLNNPYHVEALERETEIQKDVDYQNKVIHEAKMKKWKIGEENVQSTN